MPDITSPPASFYGILHQNSPETAVDIAVEQIKTLGYTVIDGGYSSHELRTFSEEFDCAYQAYLTAHGQDFLKKINEHYTMRAPLTNSEHFLKLALNSNLFAVLKKLIAGKFILNQQNGIINPPHETYNQGAWHRDLPYQHFVSSHPLAINALFCLDEFTVENGATFVLPASHKQEAFSSGQYIEKNALQIEAKAGSFILLDCMLFHAGGFNRSQIPRRAVNHVYNIPYFKQQIRIPANMHIENLSIADKEILGFNDLEPSSVADYLKHRSSKQ